MKTSTACSNHDLCPKCSGSTTRDWKGRGFVRHMSRINEKLCDFERGERDKK